MEQDDRHNIIITSDSEGNIYTNDEAMNRIIRQSEMETGMKLAFAIPGIHFEDDSNDKVYLVLLNFYDEDIEKDWFVSKGRQFTYDKIKNLIKDELIDPNESFIIGCEEEFDDSIRKFNMKVNTRPITVFRFMKVMYDSGKIVDDESYFDINEFDPNNGEVDKTIFEV